MAPKTLRSSDLNQLRKQLEAVEAFNALDVTDLKGLQITLIHNNQGAGRPIPATVVWIPSDHASFDSIVDVVVTEAEAKANAASSDLVALGVAGAPVVKAKG